MCVGCHAVCGFLDNAIQFLTHSGRNICSYLWGDGREVSQRLPRLSFGREWQVGGVCAGSRGTPAQPMPVC